ncbi:hypothetical protein [Microbacterium sp. NPDC058389]
MLLVTIEWARRCARVEAEYAHWSALEADEPSAPDDQVARPD